VSAGPDIPRRPTGQRFGLWLIEGYRSLRAGHPSPCRFVPSCSAYAAEAIESHGLWRGSRLAARRLLRCHPFGSHGVDLVPVPIERNRSPR
jgi:uncharacterized protein